jgi:hypothetical protein
MNLTNRIQRTIFALTVLWGAVSSQAQTAIPPNYAMPAGSVDTTKPGFRVRPYQTTATHGGSLAWSEAQLAGMEGPNIADLTGVDAQGYLTVPTVVNWNISAGSSVDNFAGADAMPGIGSNGTVNFTEEVLTYIEFPAAGSYTMGVNSDDGFGVAAALLNPKDSFNAIEVGKYDNTRGSGDSLFSVSVSQAGIYPFRMVYFQVGGGANVSWFTVLTNSTSTNNVLINDLSTAGALKAYASAKVAPPFVGGFVHSPAGFTFTITDDATALLPSSLQVKFNGANATVTTNKIGSVTTVSYAAPALLPAGVTNTVAVQFTDNAQPPHNGSATFTFAESAYAALPPEAALPSTGVDTTQRGFLYRIHQIDSATSGVLAANIAHAEAQLAGLLTDPSSGKPYANAATAGTQPDGSYLITNVLNFSYDTTAEQGSFTTANAHPDATFPGQSAANSDNMAGEIVTYLDLKAGFYQFVVNATDGFRVTAASNPYDALGATVGLFDYRSITKETPFGVAVQTAGIYPIRLVWFRMTKAPDNSGDASLEFYSVNSDGSKSLVNDSSDPKAIKAYSKRTAGYGTYLKHAGPSSFISPFLDGSDVGFQTVDIIISDGSTNKVNTSSVSLSVDVTNRTTTASSANGLTTLSYTPAGLQLPRMSHTATLVYADSGGASHTNTWNFHLLRNYVLPAPLFFEDFESTAAGPNPTVPTGWVQQNFTGSEHAGNDPTDLNSDFYLGWVVVDKSFNISKDTGVSAFAPQVLNGKAFSEDTNPLLVNHYVRAESDARQNGPPGQIQYLTTKSYDLTGKTGIVVAFDSSYEQNQDSIAALEYTVDNGTTWHPVLYWLMGDYDTQAPPDTIRDGVGNIDVTTTMMTQYGDVARYTDTTTGQLVGGYYGFFIKAPITKDLAPYIEGRMNDDGTESKRIEIYSVPLADNQKSVMFRFVQAGTSSWYWAIDNWGIYSVTSIAGTPTTTPGPLSAAFQNGKVVVSWTGGGTLQTTTSLPGTWTDVPASTSPYSVSPTGGAAFYRLRQ